jgi:hypothetical protein
MMDRKTESERAAPVGSQATGFSPRRCGHCGCNLKYRAHTWKESLATKEQRQELIREVVRTQDFQRAREQFAALGHRLVWVIGESCPGCGAKWETYRPYATQEETEAIAAGQNAAAETPEAVREAAGWAGDGGPGAGGAHLWGLKSWAGRESWWGEGWEEESNVTESNRAASRGVPGGPESGVPGG